MALMSTWRIAAGFPRDSTSGRPRETRSLSHHTIPQVSIYSGVRKLSTSAHPFSRPESFPGLAQSSTRSQLKVPQQSLLVLALALSCHFREARFKADFTSMQSSTGKNADFVFHAMRFGTTQPPCECFNFREQYCLNTECDEADIIWSRHHDGRVQPANVARKRSMNSSCAA